MRGPISRLAASMAEARAERADSTSAPSFELDDLDDRSTASLLRLRRWRIVRLAVSLAAVPVGWMLSLHLPGLLPVVALTLCMAGAVNALLTTYLLVHVQQALAAARYEDRFRSAQPGGDERGQ